MTQNRIPHKIERFSRFSHMHYIISAASYRGVALLFRPRLPKNILYELAPSKIVTNLRPSSILRALLREKPQPRLFVAHTRMFKFIC